jgi:hypothetical protein
MKSNDPKFITSSVPVNSRTTRAQKKEQKLTPQLQKRRLQTQHQHRFGLSLVEQIHLRKHKSNNLRTTKLAAYSITFAIAGVCLVLGAIRSSGLLIALGSCGLVATSIMLARQTRNANNTQQAHNLASTNSAALFDLESLEKFDQALNLMSVEVSEEIAVQLLDFKQQILRLSHIYASTSINEHFTQEDKLYVVEAVRRYLPDSLQAYLRIPAEQRNQILPQQGHSARQLLSHQIELIANELGKREAKLKQNAAVELIKQQHFLESKQSTSNMDV